MGAAASADFHPFQMVIANDVAHQFGLYEQTANAAIMRAVKDVANESADFGGRLRVVDVETQFGGYLESSHSISCGDTDRPKPWVNVLRYSTSQAARIVVSLGEGDLKQVVPDQVKHDLRDVTTASFHPTEEGQRQMNLALQSTLTTSRTATRRAPATALRRGRSGRWARQGSNLSTVTFIEDTPDSSTTRTASALVELNASAVATEPAVPSKSTSRRSSARCGDRTSSSPVSSTTSTPHG